MVTFTGPEFPELFGVIEVKEGANLQLVLFPASVQLFNAVIGLVLVES